MRRVKRSRRTTRSRVQSRRARRGWWNVVAWHADLPPWRRRLLHVSGALTLIVVLFGGMIWANRVDLPGRMANAIHDGVIGLTQWAGFNVREVYVAGRTEATREALIAAIGTKVGDPIFRFDPDAARQRLMKLGWVADARIERRLPDTILVFLQEREPVAIWQWKKRFVLVDGSGAIIGPQGLDRYRHLKVIIGEDAPKHAATLLAMLNGEPDMMSRVTHATWVSGRRWDIRIEGSIDVRLPADNPQAAWSKFNEMDREHGLLRRDISAIDLRVPDRVTVRTNRTSSPASRRDGQT